MVKQVDDHGVGVLRTPPLPTFDNPAYESSEADLESRNNTINSTKSLRSDCHMSTSSRNNSDVDDEEGEGPEGAYEERSTNPNRIPLDPVQELRNLTREISPGVTVTLTKSLESQLQRLNSRNDITRFPVIITPGGLSGSRSPSIKRSSKKEKMSDSDISYIGNGNSNYVRNSNFILVNSKGSKNGEIDIPETEKQIKTYYGFTIRQWMCLVIFAAVNALTSMCVSLLSPFYPGEAAKKGASETEVGFVFGIYECIVFVSSPVLGKHMKKIGPRNAFNFGILTTGACSFIFGFLTYVDNRFVFIGLSLLLRIIAAFGSAAQVTATFTLIAVEFTDNVFTIFAAMETCTGMGLIMGPLVGSVLFSVGGRRFMLPFSVLGGLLLLGGFLAFFVLPDPAEKKTSNLDDKDDAENSEGGFFKVMKIPSVALAAFSICTAAISIGFNGPVLEPHIKIFGLDDVTKGFIFVINGGTYALTATFWGRLCDKTTQPKMITLLGASLIFVGFLLIGPAPFVPLETMLWLTCVGLFIQGLGLGAAFVSGFTQGLRSSIESGFPENVSTFGLISGMWMSMFALGNFIGPCVAGILKDLVGYREGSLFVMAVQLIVVLITTIFILRERKNGNAHVNRDSELEIHDGSGIAVKEAKFFTNSEFTNNFDNGIQNKAFVTSNGSVDKIV